MKAEEILHVAVEKKTPEERVAYLDAVCGPDKTLRVRVEGLLQALEAAGSFLERPLFEPTGAEEEPPCSEKAGTMIGPYKLLEVIGEGGMGTVFLAEQQQPVRRKVALKLIRAGMDSRRTLARFETERQTLALMDHPNIAKVFDAGLTESGRSYFVMEYFQGVPLTEYCDAARLSIQARLELLGPVCQAVQHAHQKGIIHRDLKPSNILIALYDGRPVPKLIDFGLAKATQEPLTLESLGTAHGQLLGTPLYMSPEQAELNNLDIDTRTDIYALGVILYELLTGTTPLERERLKDTPWDEVLRLIREEEPPTPSTKLGGSGRLPAVAAQRQLEPAKLARLVRGELDWIVMKCLEKDRDRRYETANSLALDLEHYLADEPVLAGPPSAPYRLRKFARRHRGAILAVFLAMAALATLAGIIGWVIGEAAARESSIRHQIGGSLQAAQTLLTANQPFLARQKLAEARVLIGNNSEAFADMAAKLEAFETDLDRCRRFRDLIDLAHEAEVTGLGGRGSSFSIHNQQTGLIAEASYEREPSLAVPLLLEALARYQVLDRDDWWQLLEGGFVEPGQVEQLRRSAYEELLWLAKDLLERRADHRSGKQIPPESAARNALAYLTPAERTLAPTQAFYRIRAACQKALGNEKAAIADLQQVSQTPATMAIDYYLQGEAAFHAENKAEAIKAFEAALHLEPTHFWSMFNLGCCLCDLSQGPEDWREAIAVFSGCIMRRPDYPNVYRCRSNAYAQMNRSTDALADCSKAIALNPAYAAAWSARGIVHSQMRQWDKALLDCTRAIKLAPESAHAWYSRGGMYELSGELDKAIADFTKAIQLAPTSLQPLFVRGQVYERMKQWDKAIVDYTTAIKLAPWSGRAWYRRGSAYALSGNPEKGLADFTRAIELYPTSAPAYFRRGRVYDRMRRWDKALVDYTKAIELDPAFAPAWSNRGETYRALGKVHDAIADFSKAIQVNPHYWSAWHNRGSAYSFLGKLDLAISDFNKSLELAPKVARTYYRRGNTYVSLRQLDKAIADYTRAIDLDPNAAGGWIARGTVHQEIGQVDKAIADYGKAILVRREDGRAYSLLAWLLVTHDDPRVRDVRRAVELAKKAVDLAPTAGSYWNTLGAAYYRAGDWQAALNAMDKAIELGGHGGDGLDWYFVAMAHWQLNHKNEARAFYRKAVQWRHVHDPDSRLLRSFEAEATKLLGIQD